MKNSFFNVFRKGDYQRENFDDFLRFISFHFTKKAVHIAGTNGKGSVANFLSQIFIDNGYKVGVFSSPFLNEPNELIRVNNVNISDDEFFFVFNKYKNEIEKFNLSAFEVQTFVALTYFEETNCDICFIECGMGGLMDATNVFTPILSIITSVSLEHTGYLGKTVAEIAFSKAGIIKDFVPCVVGNVCEEAFSVISSVCVSKHSPLHKIVEPSNVSIAQEGYIFDYETYKNVKINSKAYYMVENACLALESVNIISKEIPIYVNKIISSMNKECLPCRFTIFEDKKIIIDGAHNPEASFKLKESINNYFQNENIHIIFACFKDKNLNSMLANLGEITNDIMLTTFENERARCEDDYFLFLGDYQFNCDAMDCILKIREKYPDDYILITGSLAFAGYMIERLK